MRKIWSNWRARQDSNLRPSAEKARRLYPKEWPTFGDLAPGQRSSSGHISVPRTRACLRNCARWVTLSAMTATAPARWRATLDGITTEALRDVSLDSTAAESR